MNASSFIQRIIGRYQRTVSRYFYRRFYQLKNGSAIISFTFDDFPRTALEQGGEILTKFKTVGTYYASLGLMGQESPAGKVFLPEDLNILINQGHELGCHTFKHFHSWNTNPEIFESSIVENRRALNKVLPSYSFRTFSFPICVPKPQIKKRVSKHFECCRSGGQKYNNGVIDLNALSAYFLEKSRHSPEIAKNIIDQTCASNGWLIMATHDVCNFPSPFGCTPQFFEEIVRYAANSGAKLLPVAKAWDIIRQLK